MSKFPKDIVHTENFQSFMSVHKPEDTPWTEVEARVRAYLQSSAAASVVPRPKEPKATSGGPETTSGAGETQEEVSRRFLKLCLGLAKYDLNGAPSNWVPQLGANTPREVGICEWALWVWCEYSSEEVDEVISSYDQGFIPDCYEYLIEYD
jgi:hypothetical protein